MLLHRLRRRAQRLSAQSLGVLRLLTTHMTTPTATTAPIPRTASTTIPTRAISTGPNGSPWSLHASDHRADSDASCARIFHALIDSGADRTVVPKAVIDALKFDYDKLPPARDENGDPLTGVGASGDFEMRECRAKLRWRQWTVCEQFWVGPAGAVPMVLLTTSPTTTTTATTCTQLQLLLKILQPLMRSYMVFAATTHTRAPAQP